MSKSTIVKLRESGVKGNQILTIPHALKSEIECTDFYKCEAVDGKLIYTPIL